MFGFGRRKVIGGIRVGKPEAHPKSAGHVAGVREGNAKGNLRHAKGFRKRVLFKRGLVTGSATRSTGINPGHHGSITPGAPSLSPS